jgi:hypothetical protein
LEYRTFLAADAFHEIAKVAQTKGSSLPVWTPADTKLGIPPPPDWKSPIKVDVPGIGVVEFPAWMTPQEIKGVLSRHFPAAQQATADKIAQDAAKSWWEGFARWLGPMVILVLLAFAIERGFRWVKTGKMPPIQPSPPPKK